MKERASTKLLLFASPELQDLGQEIAEKLLESCRKVLRSSGFWFKDDWARVISGEEQGVYAWVSANYALGTLKSEAEETTGIVELGGASLQDAAGESLYEDYRKSTPFSDSRKRSLVNPCVPRGYKLTVHASDEQLLASSLGGDFSECKSQVLALLKSKQDV